MNGGLGGLDVLRQVEAKYPALLFKQQLTAYVEKLYGTYSLYSGGCLISHTDFKVSDASPYEILLAFG